MKNYTGINKIIKSETLQTVINSVNDGSFREFSRDWKWILSFLKKYFEKIAVYTLIGVLESSLGVASAYIGRILINIVVSHDREKFGVLIAAMLGLTAFSLLLSSLNSRIFTKISVDVNNDIQKDVFKKISDAKWKDLSAYNSGDLLSRFNSDAGVISSGAISWIPNLIIGVYTFILTFVVLFRMDAVMALIAVLSAPFLLFFSRGILRKQREYRKKVLEINSGMMSFETEAFSNLDLIKSLGIFGFFEKKLRSRQQLFRQCSLDYNKFQIKTNILLTFVGTAVSLAAFGYCLFRLWTGQILYGDMAFFLQQRSKLSSRFNTLVDSVPVLLNCAVSARRLREIADLPKEEHDSEGFEKLRAMSAHGLSLHFNNVSFSYDSGRDIYRDACLMLCPGDVVAVLAPSGGGKTTLLRMLLSMFEPQSGSVTVSGSDGVQVPVNGDIRKLFSYVPQGNTVFSGTVAENMRMVCEDATDEQIISALETACAWEFLKKDGLNTVIGERGRGLSEGQAQRIAIARAILKPSPVLILDEATSALDVETEKRVIDGIIKSDDKKIIIVATHRPSVLKMCTSVYRINGGKIKKETPIMNSTFHKNY